MTGPGQRGGKPPGARIAKGTLSTFSCDRPQNGFQPTEHYILGPSGEELTMLDGSGNRQRTNIYGGSALLAIMDEQTNPAYSYCLLPIALSLIPVFITFPRTRHHIRPTRT